MLSKMERLLILVVLELLSANTGVVASAESFSSSSASSSAQSSSTGASSIASSSANPYSTTYLESENCDENTSICDENEVYDDCPAPCPPKRCDVDERIIRCKAPPKVGDPECIPGCRCIDNYYRNDNNVCVPKNKCPVKCKDNEIFDYCPAKCPPQECGVDPAVILCAPNPKLGDPKCEPSCRCIDGFYRNDFGDCVPQDQCLRCYGQNEIPGCKVICPPQTCESIGKHYFCPFKPINPPCKPVCRCKPGYYRNKIGNCISKSDCLKCTGPHEYFSCGSACDNNCYNLSKQNQTSCPIVNIKCNDKCYCENGYARNSTNICVPFAECPPETEPNCNSK